MSNLIRLLAAPGLKVRQRRLADDWLRTSTGAFVPEKYAERAAELCSTKHTADAREDAAEG